MTSTSMLCGEKQRGKQKSVRDNRHLPSVGLRDVETRQRRLHAAVKFDYYYCFDSLKIPTCHNYFGYRNLIGTF